MTHWKRAGRGAATLCGERGHMAAPQFPRPGAGGPAPLAHVTCPRCVAGLVAESMIALFVLGPRVHKTRARSRFLRLVELVIAASGPLDYYPDPGIDGERAAIEQDCVEADRQQALKEANRQHQEDLDAWNALGRVKKAITRQPERQEPEDPAPPTQARIDEYRQETLIRRVVQKIREVLNYFLNQELVPADRVAARAFEESREREPLHPEQDLGHYRGR